MRLNRYVCNMGLNGYVRIILWDSMARKVVWDSTAHLLCVWISHVKIPSSRQRITSSHIYAQYLYILCVQGARTEGMHTCTDNKNGYPITKTINNEDIKKL